MAERIIATNVNIAPLVGGISSGVSINSPTLIRSAINSPTINRGFFNSPKVKNEITFGPSFFSSSNQIGSKTLNFTKQGFVGTIYDSRTGGSFLIGANHIDPSPNLSPGSNNISPNRYFSPSHNIVISGPSLHNTPFRDIANCPSKVGANIDVGGAYESPAANSPFSNNNQTISINSGQTLFFPPGSSNTIGGGFTKKNAFINVRPSSSPGMSTIGVGINSPTSSPNVGFHVDTGSRFDCPVTITNNGSGTTIGWTKSNGGKKDWTTNPTPGNSPTFGINSSPNTAQNGSPLGYSPGFNVEITASSLFNCPVHHTAPVTFHASPIFVNGTLTATELRSYQSDLFIKAITGPSGGGNITMTCADFSLGSDTLTLTGEKLVLGSGSATALKIDSTSTSTDNLLLVDAANDKVSSQARITAAGFSTAGSVGIGTANTPSNILQVVGNAKFDDTPYTLGLARSSNSPIANFSTDGKVRFNNTPRVPGLTISTLGVLKAPSIQFSSIGSSQTDTGNEIRGLGTGRIAMYANDATMFDFTRDGSSLLGSSSITSLTISANKFIQLVGPTKVDSFENGINNSITFNCPNVNFNFTPNLPGIHLTSNTPKVREELGLGNVTNESKATMFTDPTFTGSITGTLGTAAQPNITSVGTLTNLTVNSLTIDGNGNLTSTGNTIIVGEVVTSSINNDGSGDLLVSGTAQFSNTPNLPGIHLTSNTPAFRSELGVYGGNDNATFNTITLTTLSNTALVVQPLNHSKPRLQVSNTSSPSVINGTFNGSPTFAGPVTFTSSPTMRGLKITNGGLPVFANNAAATSGGLALGQVYRASGFGSPVAGTLMVRF